MIKFIAAAIVLVSLALGARYFLLHGSSLIASNLNSSHTVELICSKRRIENNKGLAQFFDSWISGPTIAQTLELIFGEESNQNGPFKLQDEFISIDLKKNLALQGSSNRNFASLETTEFSLTRSPKLFILEQVQEHRVIEREVIDRNSGRIVRGLISNGDGTIPGLHIGDPFAGSYGICTLAD